MGTRKLDVVGVVGIGGLGLAETNEDSPKRKESRRNSANQQLTLRTLGDRRALRALGGMIGGVRVSVLATPVEVDDTRGGGGAIPGIEAGIGGGLDGADDKGEVGTNVSQRIANSARRTGARPPTTSWLVGSQSSTLGRHTSCRRDRSKVDG
jgi:hypothetical protein